MEWIGARCHAALQNGPVEEVHVAHGDRGGEPTRRNDLDASGASRQKVPGSPATHASLGDLRQNNPKCADPFDALSKCFRWVNALVLALVGSLFLSCGQLSSPIIYEPRPSVGPLRLQPATLEAEVNHLAEPLIVSQEATCLEIGVLLPDGSTRTYAFGRTSDTGPPKIPDEHTIFQVGSISKLFTASVVECLVQEGRIKYSDTVRDILPDGMALSRDAGRMTIYELATHTSGLPREPITFQQFLYLINYEFTGNNIYGYMDKAWLCGYLKSYKIKNKSHRFVYSNIGYAILAYLIETKTEKSFRDLVADEIFSPLSMVDTTFTLSEEQHNRLATGHVGDQPYFMKRNSSIKSWDMGEVMSPSGGIYSTASDLLLYAKHVISISNSPLNEEFVKAKKQNAYQPNGQSPALGWTLAESNSDHTRIAYKQGMTSGYSAYIGMNLSKHIAVVVLCGSFNWKDKIGHNLLLRLSSAFDL